MSLISRPRHTVEVIRTVQEQDAEGVWSGREQPPVVVACNVHPATASEVEQFGPHLRDMYMVTAPAGVWPGSEGCIVRWDGDEYRQVGRVQKSRMGVRTRHDRISIVRGNDGGNIQGRWDEGGLDGREVGGI